MSLPPKDGSVSLPNLFAELFNRMVVEQKNDIPPHIIEQLCDYMVSSGYRLVFGRWYKQEPTTGETNAARQE
jgi:hypothetical protein